MVSFFKMVMPDEVDELLSALKPSKSCGMDGLTARLLPDCGKSIVLPLTHIFNLSLSHSVFLTYWKTSTVTPFFKDGSRDEPGNYQPIRLLSLVSMMLERIFHTRLYECLQREQFLCKNQAGFRKGYSTSSCLLHFLDGIFMDIDMGAACGVLFLDLKNAFAFK